MSKTIYTHNYTYLLEYSNGMLYHGVRSCNGNIKDDPYYGSSKYTPKEIPNKTILTQHATRVDAFNEEIRYHKEHDVMRDNKYYNRANAGTFEKYITTRLGKIRKRLRSLNPKNSIFRLKEANRRKNFIEDRMRFMCITTRQPVYIKDTRA